MVLCTRHSNERVFTLCDLHFDQMHSCRTNPLVTNEAVATRTTRLRKIDWRLFASSVAFSLAFFVVFWARTSGGHWQFNPSHASKTLFLRVRIATSVWQFALNEWPSKLNYIESMSLMDLDRYVLLQWVDLVRNIQNWMMIGRREVEQESWRAKILSRARWWREVPNLLEFANLLNHLSCWQFLF